MEISSKLLLLDYDSVPLVPAGLLPSRDETHASKRFFACTPTKPRRCPRCLLQVAGGSPSATRASTHTTEMYLLSTYVVRFARKTAHSLVDCTSCIHRPHNRTPRPHETSLLPIPPPPPPNDRSPLPVPCCHYKVPSHGSSWAASFTGKAIKLVLTKRPEDQATRKPGNHEARKPGVRNTFATADSVANTTHCEYNHHPKILRTLLVPRTPTAPPTTGSWRGA